MIKAIIKGFFYSSFREALNHLKHIAKYFLPLYGESVIFILVCITFALEEYLSGKRVPVKFKGIKVNSKLYKPLFICGC